MIYLEERKVSLLISCHWSLLIPPQNIRKSEVFWCFQGVSKEIRDMKWVNLPRFVIKLYFPWGRINTCFQRTFSRFGLIPLWNNNYYFVNSWNFSMHSFSRIYLFKVSNGNTRRMYEICSKLTIEALERRHWHHSGVLNRFHTLFWCFYCWLWTSKCRLGASCMNSKDGYFQTFW